MVEVGAGDIDPRDTDDRHEVYRPDPDPPSAPVSPLPTIHVPPPSVAQVEYALTMRAMPLLAPPIGAAEANGSRQPGPVDQVKPAMFGHDRLDDSMRQRERQRQQKHTGSPALVRGRCLQGRSCGHVPSKGRRPAAPT